MKTFLAALALAIIFEGLLLATMTEQWRMAMTELLKQKDKALKTQGFSLLIIGVLLLLMVSSCS